MTTATKIEIFAASLLNLDPYLTEQMRWIEKTHAYVYRIIAELQL